jgi:hypothetical protein
MRAAGGLAAALGLLLLAGPAAAEKWSGIEPGVSTMTDVRARFGPPSRETRKKIEGYDTTEWIYEGPQAPVGFFRMSVDFGIVLQNQFQASTVRTLRVDPRPYVFSQPIVLDGWGEPDRIGEQDRRLVFFYQSGLVVIFDESRIHATTMLFTPPQPEPPAAGAPPAGGPAPPPPAATSPAAPAPPPAASPPPRR